MVVKPAFDEYAAKVGFPMDSPSYSMMSAVYIDGRQQLGRFVHRLRPGPTLEIGCGLGLPTIYLLEKGRKARGFDNDPEIVGMANNLASKLGHPDAFFVADFFDWCQSPSKEFLIIDQPREFESAVISFLAGHDNPFALVPYLSISRYNRTLLYASQLNAEVVTLNKFYDVVIRNDI